MRLDRKSLMEPPKPVNVRSVVNVLMLVNFTILDMELRKKSGNTRTVRVVLPRDFHGSSSPGCKGCLD